MSSLLPDTRKPTWPNNLLLRGGKFYVSVRVPESLRGVVTAGRGTHLRRSLKTRNEAEALRRHRHVEAELKARIEAARREPDGARKGKDPKNRTVAEDAAWWREALSGAGVRPVDAFEDLAFSDAVDRMLGEPEDVDIDHAGNARPIYDQERHARTSEFVALVRGDLIPVSTELERFLGDKRGKTGAPLSTRYVSRIRRAVRGLEAWLKGRPEGDNVGGVTRYVAGLYAEHLGATCNTRQTALPHHLPLLLLAVDGEARCGDGEPVDRTSPRSQGITGGCGQAPLHGR
jgi:hypothetical protein